MLISKTTERKGRGEYFIIPLYFITGNGDIQWCFSQVKGTLEDDVTEGKFDFSLILSFILSVYTY